MAHEIDLTDEDPAELLARAARIRRRAAEELDTSIPALAALAREAEQRAEALERRAAELAPDLRIEEIQPG